MMKAENLQRMHIRVYGHVQGVGFRYFTMTAAAKLKLTGWVRNRRDGFVEVVAEGDLEKLEKLARILKQGKNSSSVSEIKADLQEASGEYGSFFVRPTL